jgi:hypothetical protein
MSRETLAREISLPFFLHAGDVDGTLSLEKADHLRHRVCRRDRDQYAHRPASRLTA